MPKSRGSTAGIPKAKGQKVATTLPAPAPAPAWPIFKPQLPVTDLDIELVDTCPDKVVLINHFWPKSLCSSYVAFLKGLPLLTTPGRPKKGEALRVNDRFQVEDALFARRLWAETGLREALAQDDWKDYWGGEVVGLNSNIRIYRYSKGQYFDAHYDDSNAVAVPSDTDATQLTPCKTTWTLLLYLTSSAEGCMGGETVFYPHDRRSTKEEIVVKPETGMLLLHKHGEDCMLHEGREVTAGEKWILRTDLCVRK